MAAAVALGIGACLGALAIEAISPLAVLFIAGAVGVLAAIIGRDRGPKPLRQVRWLPLAAGIGLIAIRAMASPALPPAGSLPTGDGPWTGTITSVGSAHGATRPAILRLDEPPGLIVAATLPWYPAVGADDRVSLKGTLEPPTPDDFGQYLRRIGASGSLRAEALSLLLPPPGLARWLEEQRRAAATGLERALPEPEAGLAAGILIGLRDHVDRQLAADFTTSGVSHIVAISGWNIAIVATSIGALAGGLGRRRRTVLTSIAIVAYVAFVGPSPSVVRAAAMAGLVLLARELGRPSRATSALGWAVAGLLLVDPGWIDDAGFRLSVLATAGLMAWGTGLARRLSGPRPGRVRSWLAESLGVSLAAQAATLPVILLEFGRLSLVSPLVNLAVVPLVAPAMGAGAVALVAGVLVGLGLPGAIATIAGLPAWVLLAAIVGGVRIGAGVPLASVTLEPPLDVIAAAASALGIVVGATRGPQILASLAARRTTTARPPSPRAASPTPATPSASTSPNRHAGRSGAAGASRLTRWAVAALVGASLALAIAVVERPPGTTTVTVLDVGQGDGILVESADGQRLLVDGGPDPGGLVRTLDERLPPWDRRIDILVLSHPHEDHVAGLALLIDRYRVRRVYEPGMIGPGPGYRAWTEALARRGVAHGTLSTGDRFELADIGFRVLWPDPGRVPLHPADGGTAINNVSIVLLGTVGAHRFLLAGDIEQAVDPEVLARGLPQVDLLKVAHHGSKTASTEPFLETVHPRIAIVSAGLGNPYGHPAPATIARLEAITKQTYRTDLDGTVQVRFEGDALRVRTSGPARHAAAVPAQPGTDAATVASAARPAFDCGIARSTPAALASLADPLPVVGESPLGPPSGALARAATAGPTAAGAGAWHLDRIPARDGPATGLSYHRADDRTSPSRVDSALGERLRQRPARLPLGRRRLRARRDRRGVPARRIPLPRRRPGALAAGRGGGRVGPLDPGARGTARHGFAVR
jgi:competence protein ComEC